MKKPRLYLHIGAGKTGTTALQSFCVLNEDRLQEQGFHYLKSPRWGDNSHHLLGFALWGSDQLDLPKIPNVELPKVLNRLSVEVKSLQPEIDNVILSSELLLELAASDKVLPLVNFIRRHFKSVVIVCYLRRQDEHIQSLYLHWMKTRHQKFKNKSIQQFIEDFKGDYWFNVLNRWAHFFTRENIRVRVYEKSQFVGGDIFSDFADALGFAVDEGFEYPNRGHSNISLNPNAAELMRVCGDFISANTLAEMGLDMSGRSGKSRNLLSNAERRDLLQRYEQSNRSVAIEYLGRPDGKLFFEDVPTEGEIFMPTQTELMARYVFQGATSTKKELQALKMKSDFLREQIEKLLPS